MNQQDIWKALTNGNIIRCVQRSDNSEKLYKFVNNQLCLKTMLNEWVPSSEQFITTSDNWLYYVILIPDWVHKLHDSDVLCWVSDSNIQPSIGIDQDICGIALISKYSTTGFNFVDNLGYTWRYASPISKKDTYSFLNENI